MSLLLNDEQRMLSDSARDFLQQRSPVALQRRLRDETAGPRFDPSLWQQAVDLGWPVAGFAEDHGGLGVGYQGLGAVFEQIGRQLAALPLLSSVVLCGELLVGAADEAQRQRWLASLQAGSLRMALAVDESDHRHDPLRPRCAARRESGGWRLDGDKWFVIDGVGAEAYVVVARERDGLDEEAGLGLFVVDADTPGLAVTPQRLADSRNHARVRLDGVWVDESRRLAAADAGAALERALDRGRALVAAEQLGLLRWLFETTVDYLKQRVQFDVPIGSFQALQHRAARLFVELELLDSCVRAALEACDHDAADLPALASLAKARAAELSRLLGNEALQLHGGIGVTDELDVGLYVKRARVLQHLLGDALYHRGRYADAKGF